MKRRSTALIFAGLAIFAASPALQAQEAQEDVVALLEANAHITQKVMVPMRDGTRMAADVYRPKTDAPVPIIFSRTPYNFASWRDGEFSPGTYRRAWEAVRRGYAYVVMNERGRYYSEGNWDILGTPLTDSYDAFEWMEDQPWSNGKVGTLGCSSTAEWQMAAGSLNHEAHTTLVAQGFGAGVGRIGDWYEQGNWYRGGAEQMLFFAWLYGVQQNVRPMFPPNMTQEQLAQVSRYFDLAAEMPSVDWSEGLWHLPLSDILSNVSGNAGPYEDMIKRRPNDPKWYQGGLYHDDMPFDKPAMWFMSWYDVSTGPNLALFNHMVENAESAEARANQYAVIAPTLHCAYTRATENTVVGERSVGDARWDYDALVYGWMDMWLKGEDNGLTDTLPRVRYYTMGSNRWQSANSWPPENAEEVTYYLDSGGSANTLHGDGVLTTTPPTEMGWDDFTYDPMDPVTSYGGNVCCTGNAVRGGAFDQREMEEREDILVYTSEPLTDGIEVTGTIGITLHISTDVKDTDFTVKLIDVYPDGTAYNLDETIQRARYLGGYDAEEYVLQEGEVYTVELSPMSTSNFFAAGHRIRIEVSSSNFPRFTRNLNTGGNNWDETEGVVAHNRVHHAPRFMSQIRLPIVRPIS